MQPENLKTEERRVAGHAGNPPGQWPFLKMTFIAFYKFIREMVDSLSRGMVSSHLRAPLALEEALRNYVGKGP
jgi:hypothetical protein